MPVHAVLRKSALRKAARKVAAAMPLGIGRHVRAHGALKAEVRRLGRQVAAYDDAYRGMLAEVLGRAPEDLDPADAGAPGPKRAAAHRAKARDLRDLADWLDHLAAGESLERAFLTVVRRRLAAGDRWSALSLAQGLQASPSTRTAGQLGAAVVAVEGGHWGLARASLAAVPPELAERLAPAEFHLTALRTGPGDREAALARLRRLAADAPADLASADWLRLVEIALAERAEPAAAALFAAAETLARRWPARWAGTEAERAWLRPWIDGIARPVAPPPVPDGHVALAVLDYKQPSHVETSRNVGDYVQTLASLGHLVRHRNVRLHGPADLVGLVESMRPRLRPELALDTPARDVTLVPVHRDASTFCAVPEDTWAVVFGWFMQSVFGRYDLPPHPNLRPVFVSFHCNKQEVLSPATIEYLRAHGPVGCRDWTTVDLLLSAGVPAFFSGCLTTTADATFRDLDPRDRPGPDAPVAHVDVGPTDAPAYVTHSTEDVRGADLVANLRRATGLLESYRRRYSRIVTSRLHCYLPARALGAEVEFQPRNPADIRYPGLVDLSDEDFAGMRRGILDKLAAVLEAVLAGKEPADVYALWRGLCADDVAAARARRAAVPPLPPPALDVAAACRLIRAAEVTTPRTRPGPGGTGAGTAAAEVHVALALDANLRAQLPVVVQAMADNCSRPLRLWILCRGHRAEDYARLAAAFPEVTITWLPCDAVDYGPIKGMIRHVTVSTMDRLLLPDLLPERDRIVYHDIDALPLGDVAELYDWDLGGHAIAARPPGGGDSASGFARILRTAKRLKHDPAAAADLMRRMYARHDYDFAPFNAGVLVLSLARLRADGFGQAFLPFVERYGMNDQDVLNCYAGPNRADLPARWNALPGQEVLADPQIIHWAGCLKPWQPAYVAHRDIWQRYAERARRRMAEPA